jgi:hypothetical protein
MKQVESSSSTSVSMHLNERSKSDLMEVQSTDDADS